MYCELSLVKLVHMSKAAVPPLPTPQLPTRVTWGLLKKYHMWAPLPETGLTVLGKSVQGGESLVQGEEDKPRDSCPEVKLQSYWVISLWAWR